MSTRPEYLFEVSWEVCNKIGGVHTVITSKSASLVNQFGDKYIVIGPDLVVDEGDNPAFQHDPELFRDWVDHAAKEGLRIKTGHWKIPSRPIAILIDFSDFFAQKDAIFSKLWEDYKLDSLSGQWDYIEPALFGFATGKLIESFIKFKLNADNTVAAHFHDWLTGAGILYLEKQIPQVATIYSVHSTIVGRTLAGNKKNLYSQLDKINADAVAKEYKIVSKHSLERMTAHVCDVFTTVSEITAQECEHILGKKPDIIAPNGFELPASINASNYEEQRTLARNKMLQVASSLLADQLPNDTFILATSGRYEFINKGYDVFIDAIKEIQESGKIDRPILAFLFVPASHYGPRKELKTAIENHKFCECGLQYMTHYLHDPEWDLILENLKKHKLINNANDKVKVIFVPAFLDGNDGIFNMTYNELLIGCDQTVAASYYEPWGYSPLESLSYSVPTIISSLSGLGNWLKNEDRITGQGVVVLERNDENHVQTVSEIKDIVLSNYSEQPDKIAKIRSNAKEIAGKAHWEELVQNYLKAFELALERSFTRSDKFIYIEDKQTELAFDRIIPMSNEPQWKRIIVKSNLPEKLEKLHEIIQNIWWTWDDEAQDLFRSIDLPLWKEADYNPFILLEKVPYSRLNELVSDKKYLSSLENVYIRLQEYLKGREELSAPQIAYFSMEFGFHDCLKLYSGGLGILAGDYLKEASDAKCNIVGVGLLYRYGYFTQKITNKGEQQANYEYQHFSKLPIHPVRLDDDEFLKVDVMFPGRVLHARVWYIEVGRIRLYLLDTDFEDNLPEDRVVTHQLYGGDNENRLKQELLLGVGGIRALAKLGIKPNIFHSNEGHSAFIGAERIRRLMTSKQLTFNDAKEIVRSSTLFTTHTPVPAGHDHFDEDMLRKYLGHYPDRLNISWEEFMALGRSNPNNWSEKFNMSYLAAHLAQEVNGVSMLHGEVTKDMFACIWPGFLPSELHVSYVTNGVHWSTWTAPEWKHIYNEMFENNFVDDQHDHSKWEKIYNYSDKQIWDIKQTLRTKLITTVKERFKENWIKRHEDPKKIMAINNALSEDVLTIVFARRFATYKRAQLLFRDLDRLSSLLNNKKRPLQFIFAGKAHPADGAGQGLIKMIVEISKRPEFLGKILFIENYSIELAKMLVSGADIWLNTPTRPLEASGTSGEKAVMNGTLHFSVLDGWWVEGYKPDAGWALTNERTYENQDHQDELDAEIIYSLFEDEILPAFYDRNKEGIPTKWVQYVKNTIAGVSPKFTTRRMINDYIAKFYNKLHERSLMVNKNSYQLAIELSNWKKYVLRTWDEIELVDVKLLDKNTETIISGYNYGGEVVLRLNNFSSEHVGVELVVVEEPNDLVDRKEFDLVKESKGVAVYQINASIQRAGTFKYGVRVYPKHELLPHRQDFAKLMWI